MHDTTVKHQRYTSLCRAYIFHQELFIAIVIVFIIVGMVCNVTMFWLDAWKGRPYPVREVS